MMVVGFIVKRSFELCEFVTLVTQLGHFPCFSLRAGIEKKGGKAVIASLASLFTREALLRFRANCAPCSFEFPRIPRAR